MTPKHANGSRRSAWSWPVFPPKPPDVSNRVEKGSELATAFGEVVLATRQDGEERWLRWSMF
jgi:hypothetical protein